MVAVQAIRGGHGITTQPLLSERLGNPVPNASLTRQPAPGVKVRIDRAGFRVAGHNTAISLSGVGTSTGRWARYSHGVARATSFGRETVVVTPDKTEQFLTVDRRQGKKTWQWRLGSLGLSPRIGADGAVGFVAGNTLSASHVEPVAILDERGQNITPHGLRWSVSRDRHGWMLALSLNDSKLPTPYVIDPAIVLRGATGSNSAGAAVTSMVFNVPAGVALNDFMVAQVTIRGGTTNVITTPGCGCWTLIRRDDSTTNLTQALYYHVATGAEPASYTWTIGAAQRDSGGIIVYTGVDNAAPVDVQSGAIGNSVNVQAPSVTTTFANDMLVGLFGIRSNSTFTPPGGMTERWDTVGGGVSPASESADVTQAGAGISGAKTAVATTAAVWVGQLIGLKLDTGVPANALSLSSVAPAGSAFLSGTTVFYRGSPAGSFQLTNAVTDAGSGPASSAYPALGGTTTGWTHTNQTITTPAGGPYVSTNSFAWSNGTSSSPTEAVQAADNAANTATTTLTFTNDTTNPTGSVTAPAASANVRGNAVTVSSDSLDGGSGVANAQFQRSPAGGGVWTTIATDTTSPYSVAWDSTAVADGLYDLRVITTDNVGNTFTSALITNVRVDNTNPTGAVTAPAASANVRGNAVTVSSNSLDTGGSGVANAQFQRSPAGGGVWTNIGAADTTSPYSVAWDSTAVADGLYDLRVVTTDNAGNTFTSALITNVRVDNTNPTGSLTAPAASANVRGNAVTVSSNSLDTGGSGVASADFQRSPAGAGTWTTIATDATSPYSVAWDSTAVADGLYDLRVVTTDNAGNTFTSALVTNVRVDNTNPTGAVTAPAASANVRGNAVTVSSDSLDTGGSGVANAQFQRSPAGGGVWTNIGAADTTSPYSVAWDSTAVADGLYDLRVVTTDNAGNTFTSALITNVRVDNTNPTGAVTAPAASANVRGNAVAVSSNSLDTGGSGVASADFQRSPAGAGTWTTIATDNSSPYSVAWDSTAVADGLYDLRVVTTDNVGNTFTSALVTNVRVDNTNPTGSITAPGAGANVAGNAVAVSSDSADAGSGVASADFQRSPAGAGTWTTIATDNSSPYSVAWDSTAVADGPYDLRVVTTDNAGNSLTSAIRTVMVDNSAPGAPALSFGSFTNASATGSTVYYRAGVAGGFTVTGTASDAQSGIDHLTFPGLGSGWTGGGADTSSPYNGVYTFGAGAADPTEPNDVTATNNVAITSSPTGFTVTPDSSAPVSSILCDGVSCAGSWYTSAISVSLSAVDGGSGVQEIRYTTDGSDPSPVNGTVYAAPFGLGATTTVKFRSYDAVGNEEAVGSQLVRIDDTVPSAPALTLSESPASPKQDVQGTTIFYNPQGGNSASFTVAATTSDAQSGIDKVTFPALGGMTGGGDDSSSPYQDTYSWTASSNASGAQSVTSVNNAGLSASSSFTVTPDTAPPSGGSVSYPAGYASGSVTITTADGTDALSGVNASSGVIERDDANLVDGTCDPFTGAWSAVSSPDVTIAAGHCYRYQYRVSDRVGNEAIYTSGNVVKVSINAPSAPDLTLAETPGSANQYISGSELFYSPTGGNSGTFTVSATVSDSGGSGIDKINFPSLAGMTGGGDDSTSPFQGVYDWSPGSSASGAQTVTVVNNAGFTSQANFTLTPDTAPPTGQDASVTGGYYTSLSVPVTLQNGTDALSGVDPASGILERETGTLSNGSCIAWSGSWSPVTLSGGADTTVASNKCYRYHYVISDRVGNQSAPSATSLVAKIDATTPVTSDDAPGGWQSSAVTVTLSVNEVGSGIASTVHSIDGGPFLSGTSISVPAPADHSNDGVHTIQYRSTDNAGNVEALRSATVRIDTTLPTTTDDAPAGWRTSAVTVTLTPADALSGIASTQYRVDGGAFQGGTSVAIPAPADHSNDGVHTIQYRSTDNAGNVEPLQTATVRIDTTLPAGALTAPANGAHVNGPVAISASASDLPSGVASVEFLVRPSGTGSFTSISTDTTAPYDASWDSTSAPEGDADLKVVVLDNAGLTVTSALRTVTVDNPPVPTLDNPGANVSGTVTLTASSQPDTTQVVFERSPAGAGTWTPIATDTTAPFSADLDTSVLPDGSYDLRVVATDGGGFNGTSSVRTARVDNTAPAVSVSDPASGAVVGGPNVHVAGLATDVGSGVASVRFEQRPAGGGAFTAIGTDTTAPFETSWDTTGLNGNFELRAIATDAAGNQATAATIPVIVDATAASITLNDPGALLRDVVSLSASAPSLAVASVSFERRPAGGSWTRIDLDTVRPWGAALDTRSLADGTYDLRAQALDTNGQVLATHSRDGIRIDNTAPTVLSATPANGSTVSAVTSIALVASEPVASVQGATLDGSAATPQISGANITFSTGSLGGGAHALAGSFVDAAGNTGAFSLHFTVQVEAHATLIMQVKKPTTKTKSRGSKRVFAVGLSLSTPARVQATLLSPTGKRLRTLRTQLSAGRHSLNFVLPDASLPPGRYTILVVATGSDGSKVTRRVYVTVARKHATAKKRGSGKTKTRSVAIPVAPPAPPSGGSSDTPSSPSAPTPAGSGTSKPASKTQTDLPKASPLQTASGYVSSKPRRTAGFLLVLLAMGAAIAFLIKIEMGRMLASPSRR